MATDEPSGKATTSHSLTVSPFMHGSHPGLVSIVELNEGQYQRFQSIPLTLPGCDSRLMSDPFHVSHEGKSMGLKPVMALSSIDRERGDHYMEVGEREVYDAQIYGVTAGDFIGALKASCPTSKPPIKRMAEELSKFAHQVDAVLATSKGGDAHSPDWTGGDTPYLRAGLLRYQAPRKQVYGRKSPFDAERDDGVKMPRGKMPRSTVLSPTLAILFAFEWLLKIFRETRRRRHEDG